MARSREVTTRVGGWLTLACFAFAVGLLVTAAIQRDWEYAGMALVFLYLTYVAGINWALNKDRDERVTRG